jgi:maleylpyruvate isomerase
VSARTPADARRWSDLGTRLFLDTVSTADLDGPSALPDWSRRRLVAHVAANADALGNLVHWAATGEETPMYASPEERAAGIERGAALPADELTGWLHASAERLEAATAALTDEQWTHQVTTAQGRHVPATEIPWLRAREVCVHAVDLDAGVGFADLPADFLEALAADVRAKRGDVPDVAGPLAEQVAWLTGRRHALTGAPEIGAWL